MDSLQCHIPFTYVGQKRQNISKLPFIYLKRKEHVLLDTD